MATKVAVVTGSNKGIGYATVRELLKRNVGVVYLTSRDVKRGQEAVAELNKEGLNPAFHQLDVTDKDSIKTFAKHLKDKHGGIDILINNAGVNVEIFYEICYEDAYDAIDVNYRGNLRIQKHIFPILNDNARVINVSSDAGHLANLRHRYWIETLSKKDIKVQDVNEFVDWFLESAGFETLRKEDFTEMTMLGYRISKIALCALTVVQQNEVMDRNISVNSLHPGFVQTSMTKNVGYMTLEESGKMPASLALDVPQSLKGAYVWFDGKVCDWYDVNSENYFHFANFEKRLKEAGHL